MVKITVMAVR